MPDTPQMETSHGFRFNLQDGKFYVTYPPPLSTRVSVPAVTFLKGSTHLPNYGIDLTGEELEEVRTYFKDFLKKDSKPAANAVPVFTSATHTRFDLYTLPKRPEYQAIRVTFPDGLEIIYGVEELENILKDPALRKKEGIKLVKNELLRLQRALVPYLAPGNVVPLPPRRKK